jgi:FTR1 family protein
MLPTFVITLREGLEAALIVGIIAAFLMQEGRRDALRWMWSGVGLAVVLCAAVGATLRIVGSELPHRQQEGLESIVAMVAVAMVTYMVVWMSRHARDLKGDLRSGAAGALAQGSTLALVGMAFFAVLREGFETAVFLLAVFQDSSDTAAAGTGAVLGLAVALALGYGLYRGGVRLDLSRFFRATGVVLVLVAAGLVAGTVHAAAEAGWVTAGQGTAFDVGGLVDPGSVQGSLLTGVLGLQPEPTVLEVVAWLVYAIPMLAFVLVPARFYARARTAVAGSAAVVAPAALLVGVLGGGSSASLADSGAGSGARIVHVAISAAGCEPAALRLPAGPTTFDVTAKESSKVTEFELIGGGRTLAEAENLVEGRSGRFSLTLQPGRYTMACPGGHTHAEAPLTVTGRTSGAPARSATLQRGLQGYRDYVEAQTGELVVRTRALQRALASGDVAAARRAYAAARPPYERVEPIAESFGALDPEIDARVNDVADREDWTGFHVLERRLWVDGTTAGTAPVAAALVADVERLRKLAQTVKLEPAQVGNGANALLNEVSKSKITGEEERYSHLDLLDFAANVDGARAAFDAIRAAVAQHDEGLVQVIDGRFAAVDAGLRPFRRGASGYVGYEALSRADVRRLSRLIDQLAEPLSRAPAQALRAR